MAHPPACSTPSPRSLPAQPSPAQTLPARTLLAVFAHPDDEAFGNGGTLARYAAAGFAVHLICATRGGSGKITDPDIPADSDRGVLREAELREACRALGVREPIFLDFHDSGRFERLRRDDPKALVNVDDLDLERALLPHLVRLRPTVMLTFDPHGIYGHIDHLKMHRAATAAFWSVGNLCERPPRRLFYSVMLREAMAAMQELRPASPLSDLEPELYGVSEASLAARLDVSAYAEPKRAAIRAHRSQVGPASSFANVDAQSDAAWAQMMREESFTLGGLRGSFPAPPLDDLFAGLEP